MKTFDEYFGLPFGSFTQFRNEEDERLRQIEDDRKRRIQKRFTPFDDNSIQHVESPFIPYNDWEEQPEI